MLKQEIHSQTLTTLGRPASPETADLSCMGSSIGMGLAKNPEQSIDHLVHIYIYILYNLLYLRYIYTRWSIDLIYIYICLITFIEWMMLDKSWNGPERIRGSAHHPSHRFVVGQHLGHRQLHPARKCCWAFSMLKTCVTDMFTGLTVQWQIIFPKKGFCSEQVHT